ncbi:MAG: hydroxylamine reductase [Proteobacteria bacterium]|nr:hydroxylamine reductase [Pseudomonadota bacterium]
MRKLLLQAWLAALLALAFGVAHAAIWDTVPDEQLKALNLSRSASPKELYDALTTRYKANVTKGKFAKWWEPVPIDQYMAPMLFYKPPEVNIDATRAQCVECHRAVTHGWVQSWQQSVHANLEQIRKLPAGDSRAYKKEIIAEVEQNLRAQGLLGAGAPLKEVGCIDCHMGVGKAGGHHMRDLHLPSRADCGTCHIKQFAEAESERDTQVWPQKQWDPGHPSHAVDYTANVETATWAALQQREVATSCTMCHYNQTRCDGCHTRHDFSPAEARKPEACATCHNGVDHNEYEQYLLSKHGVRFQAQRDKWDWNARLADAYTKGGQSAPTCQSCHMEYKGQYTHNVTRKVRWGFLPTPNIADNLEHPWFKERKEAWQATCQACHGQRFAQIYLDMTDSGIKEGVKLVEQTRKVVQKLYDDKLLPGQKTNRPALPEPEKDEPGAFASLFFAKGNQFTVVDRTFAEMWEQHIARYMKGLEHANPGGWTYSHGWSDLIKDQTIINEYDTTLREKAQLEERVGKLEAASRRTSWFNRGGGGGGVLAGGIDAFLTEEPMLATGILAVLGGGLLLGGLRGRRRGPHDDVARPRA